MKYFVYGTLTSLNSKHFLMSECQFIGIGILKDYQMYNISWFPGIQHEPGSFVKGEIYEINAETKNKLDDFEEIECGTYRVESVSVCCENTIVDDVFVYVYNKNIENKESKIVLPEKQPWKENNHS